jgi:hypothetical protein
MSSHKFPRELASWIAVLAILMAALAPAISHALGTQGVASWTEVCTAQGSKWVQGDSDAADGSVPAAEHALEHCPYCSIHSSTIGIPAAPLLDLAAADLAHATPSAFLAAPHTLHAWLSAQPRAPPLVS